MYKRGKSLKQCKQMIMRPEFLVMLVWYFLDFFYLPMEVFIKVTNSLVMTRDKRLFIGVWMLFSVNNFCQFVNEDAKILTDG